MSALKEAALGPDLGSALGGAPLPLLGILAVLALAPFAVVMLTSFSKIAIVLAMLRSALGTQQAPPTIVLTGLAAVLSAHVMAPVAEATASAARGAGEWELSSKALIENLEVAGQPLKEFLVRHGAPDERERFVALGRELRAPSAADEVTSDDLTVIVPAFVLTELKEAFVIAFMLFLPFLLLDMVVANVLLALGMQTLTPTQVSLPFKVLLFVAVDGWGLLSRGLVLGYRS
jgi:type III secretion protein R